MKSIGAFPFGQPVQEVIQKDRTPKDVFVLGVYASAVHARWINTIGRTVVNALAVASEPYIFWRGENAEAIIQLAHPRQIAKLGRSSAVWHEIHEKWIKQSSSEIAQFIKADQ